MPSPRPFVLERDTDATGISGTGRVAEGVEFADGTVALRWLVPPGQPGHGWPTSVVFHDNGIESVKAVHGHGGQTRIVWLDAAPLDREQIEGGQFARQRLAAWRRGQLAAGRRVGSNEEVGWLCGQLDALSTPTPVPTPAGSSGHLDAGTIHDIAKAGP